MLQTGVRINYDSSARTLIWSSFCFLFSVVEFVLKATEDIFKDGIYVLMILHSFSREITKRYDNILRPQLRAEGEEIISENNVEKKRLILVTNLSEEEGMDQPLYVSLGNLQP